MKTASLVLGIIGGVLAVIFGIVYIIGGIAAASLVGSADALANTLGEFGDAMEAEGWTVEDADVDFEGFDDVYNASVGAGITMIYVVGIISIVGAVLGIVGGAMVKKKNVVAGVLMLVAAVPSFFTGLGILASILFIIGGILALIPDKQAAPPVQA